MRRPLALKILILAAGNRPNGQWLRLGSIRAHSNWCHVSQGARNQDRSTRGNGGAPYGDNRHGAVWESPPARGEPCSPARRITEAVWQLGDAPRTPRTGLHLSKKGRRKQATGANGGVKAESLRQAPLLRHHGGSHALLPPNSLDRSPRLRGKRLSVFLRRHHTWSKGPVVSTSRPCTSE